MSAKVYSVVTDKLIAALERGTIPWRKPWKDTATAGAPVSLAGRAYRGFNAFSLAFESMDKGYPTNYWGTFRAVNAAGGTVRKGEKGTPVVLWKWPTAAQKREREALGLYAGPMVRFFNVWNVAQCDGEGLERFKVVAPAAPRAERLEAAEALVEGYEDRPTIRHGGNSAHYTPALDSVTMPEPETFREPAAYYATLFHELGHSTGHSKRLDRKLGGGFGSEPYAKEELVAELTSAFLCDVAGIASDSALQNSASYLANWLEVLRKDRKMLVHAAAAAQRAADHIRGIAPAVQAEEAEEAEAVAA